MPTDPTPDPADVQTVARAEFDHDMSDDRPYAITWDDALPFVRRAYQDRARAGLSALAAAGRLLPPDTETRTDPYSPPPTCDCSCHRCCVPLDAWCEDCEEDHGLPVPNPTEITETKEN